MDVMQVDNSNNSKSQHDLSEFNAGEDVSGNDLTDNGNSLIEFEQGNDTYGNQQQAMITVAKKKMTRSIFTIEEEADYEDQTVMSSKTGGFDNKDGQNDKKPIGNS